MSEVTKAKFDKAVQIIDSLKVVPDDGGFKVDTTDQLFFYGYFKQATLGDIEVTKPGMFEIAKKAQWNAWNSVKGTPVEVCYKKYVEKLIELLKQAGDSKYLEMVEEIEAA